MTVLGPRIHGGEKERKGKEKILTEYCSRCASKHHGQLRPMPMCTVTHTMHLKYHIAFRRRKY